MESKFNVDFLLKLDLVPDTSSADETLQQFLHIIILIELFFSLSPQLLHFIGMKFWIKIYRTFLYIQSRSGLFN